jgi:hypothetical protein
MTGWIQNHIIFFTLALFVLGSLISIYSGNMRQFLAIPPQKLNVWILKARISNMKNILGELETYEREPQRLMAAGLSYVLLALVMILGVSLITFVRVNETAIDSTAHSSASVTAQMWLMVLSGTVVMILIASHSLMLIRFRHNVTRERLTDTLEKLSQKLNRITHGTEPFNPDLDK